MSNEALKNRIEQWVRNIPVGRGEATLEDAAKFTALFNSLYARRVTPDYCRWRFDDPAARSALFVIRDSDRFIGAAGWQLCLMQGGGQQITAALYVDVMVAHSHQKSGLIFAALDRAVERSTRESGAAVAYLFPNPKGAKVWLADPSWTSLEPRLTWVCATRPSPCELDIERVNQFGSWADDMAAAFARLHPALVCLKRDRAYLNWRFASHPRHRYELFLAQRAGVPFAYLVLKTFQDPTTRRVMGDVVDLLWVENDTHLLHALLEFALGHFHRLGVSQAAMWFQTNTALDEIGMAIGFKPSGQDRHFLLKVLDAERGWIGDGGRWFLTMSDAEIY